ncbi:MAG: ubiquitin carboxyl-terminal hydrolase [Linnemannia gamsii]|nr:MAG: ubiquitin carboxyl-terminal hydrolase [Linnemannia gamsii]
MTTASNTINNDISLDASPSTWSHHWCTIESTPEVFNSLMWRNGIRGAHVQELYSLDQHTFRELARQPVYGFIFLIKPQGSRLSKVQSLAQQPDFSNVYFAKQVIPDACGTQAILSIALNSHENHYGNDDGDDGLDIGPLLRNFKEFTAGFSPLNKGLTMTNCIQLRDNHNSSAGQYEQRHEIAQDDDYHYVAYVHVDGYIWELDGLQPEPIRLAACKKDEWVNEARLEFMARVLSFEDDEQSFVLMAMTKDPLVTLSQRIHTVRHSSSLQEQIRQERLRVLEDTLRREELDREAEKNAIQEMEGDFRPAIEFFMKTLASLDPSGDRVDMSIELNSRSSSSSSISSSGCSSSSISSSIN